MSRGRIPRKPANRPRQKSGVAQWHRAAAHTGTLGHFAHGQCAILLLENAPGGIENRRTGAPTGMRVPFAMRVFSQPGLWRLAARLPQSEKGLLGQMRQMGHAASVDEGRISKAMLQWFIALHQHTDTSHNEMQGAAALMTLRGILPSLVLTPEDLASIESPTYFLWGEHDVFGPPDVGRQMVDLMPRAQLEVLPKAGHLAWLDAPEYAASVVRRHLLGESSERAKATDDAKQSLPAS